ACVLCARGEARGARVRCARSRRLRRAAPRRDRHLRGRARGEVAVTIELSPTREQLALIDTAREFAHAELAPAVARVEPWPILRDAYAQWCELGFQQLLVPEADGGAGGSCIDAVLVLEELGAV